jgi:hypothetical protein
MEFRIHYWNNRDPIELSNPSTAMCNVTAGLHTFLFNPFISKHTNLKQVLLNLKYPLHGSVDLLMFCCPV